MPPCSIPHLDRPPIHAFALRRLYAEGLAREIEVELELTAVRRAEEVQCFAQIAVRMEAVAIADQIAFRNHVVNRGTNHQKRTIELAPVERDEAGVVVE